MWPLDKDRHDIIQWVGRFRKVTGARHRSSTWRTLDFLVHAPCRERASVSAQQAANGTNETPINNDITNPIHRLDLFLENIQSAGGTTWTPKVRYERPFDLNDGWKFAARVEFTAVSTNDGSDPPGTFATGLGDTQFQGVFSKELDARQGFGFGLRFYAPTATDDQFGNGRWRMAPAAGYRYSLPGHGRILIFRSSPATSLILPVIPTEITRATSSSARPSTSGCRTACRWQYFRRPTFAITS